MKKIVKIWLIVILIVLAIVLINSNFSFTGLFLQKQESISFSGICNSNNICEIGEDDENCPQDCLPRAPKNENCLCIYRNGDINSEKICEYYAEKRPGVHTLGLNLSSGIESAQKSVFISEVIDPLWEWVEANDELKITHLAVARGIPTEVIIGNRTYGAASMLALSKEFYDISPGISGNTLTFIHFDPEKYKTDDGKYTFRFAVSYLTAYQLEDVLKMIDKAQAPIQNFDELKWFFDADEDEFPTTKINLKQVKAELIKQGVLPENIILDFNNALHTNPEGPIIGFNSAGRHHTGYSHLWMTQEKYFNLEVANRAIMSSVESYNAHTFFGKPDENIDERTIGQGRIADAVSKIAFGGENYSNSFAGAGGNVTEPYLGYHMNAERFLPAYATGLTLGETFLTTHPLRWTAIMIGDPLMRLIEDDKVGLPNGTACENNSQCYSRICGNSQIGEKFCHANQNNCVYTQQSFVYDLMNGNKICKEITSQTDILFTCENGTWKLEKAPEEYLCKSVNSFWDFDADFFKKNGLVCLSDEECYSNDCKKDLSGIKRCQNKDICPVNKTQYVNNNSFACVSENQKIKCVNGEWVNGIINCDNECIDGMCLGEFFTPPNIFTIEKNRDYYMALPINPSSKKVSDIFGTNLDSGNQIYFFRNSWTSTSFIKFGTIEQWNPDLEIKNGEGFLLNLNSDINIIIEGDEITESFPIEIKGSSNLIGIPTLGKKRMASEVLEEINLLDDSCYTIKSGGGNGKSYSITNEGVEGEDFEIFNYIAYWIICDENTNITWVPFENECTPGEFCGLNSCEANYCVDNLLKKFPQNCEKFCNNNRECVGCSCTVIEQNCGSNALCSNGVCLSCGDNFANCDGITGNGCEINVKEDNGNCGSCGNICGDGKECINGVCEDINLCKNINCGTNAFCKSETGSCECFNNYLNCDNNFSNGCELSTSTGCPECENNESRLCVNEKLCLGSQACENKKWNQCLIETECEFGEVRTCTPKINGEDCNLVLGNQTCNKCGQWEACTVSSNINCCSGKKENCFINGCEGKKHCVGFIWQDCKKNDLLCGLNNTSTFDLDNLSTSNTSEGSSNFCKNSDCGEDEYCVENKCVKLECIDGFIIKNHECVCNGILCNGFCYDTIGICCNNNWNEELDSCETERNIVLNIVMNSKNNEAIKLYDEAEESIKKGEIKKAKAQLKIAELKAKENIKNKELVYESLEKINLAMQNEKYSEAENLAIDALNNLKKENEFEQFMDGDFAQTILLILSIIFLLIIIVEVSPRVYKKVKNKSGGKKKNKKIVKSEKEKILEELKKQFK